MDSATPFDVSGRSDEPRSKLKTTLSLFCKQWPYICKFTLYLSSVPFLTTYRFFHPTCALNHYSGNMDDVLPAFQARTYVWNQTFSMDGNLLNKWIQSLSPHVRHCMFRRYPCSSTIRFLVLSVRVLRRGTASLNHLLLYRIQRAKHENSDPLMVDVAYSLGVTLLFSSGLHPFFLSV